MPPLQNDKQFQMRVSEAFFEKIDNWRRAQPGIPGRSEAIRQLVEHAMEDGNMSKAVEIAAVLMSGGYIVKEMDNKRHPLISLRDSEGKQFALTDGSSFSLPFPLYIFDGMLEKGLIAEVPAESDEHKTVYRTSPAGRA